MEGRRELDAAGRAAFGLLIIAWSCAASPADDFQRGSDLARAGRWEQARAAFLAGEREAPGDKRFPLELAGVEYRLKNLAGAKRYLRRALKLDSTDRYGNDFLGTIYFLEGNLEAALRYWNRAGKPWIDDVQTAPESKLNPLLLDSALAFAPGSILTLDELRTTEARIDALDAFAAYRLDVAAHADEHFDATLHWLQLPSWVQAVSAFRGAAYQTVQPEIRNLGGSGMNWDALFRWDAQKRRAGTALSGPLAHSAKWRYRWYADGRKETWNSGGADDFRLERVATGLTFLAVPSGRINWKTGLEVSSRHFAGLPGFPGGTALTYQAGLNYALLRIPERRLTVASTVNWEAGRMFSATGDLFSQEQFSVNAQWLPKAQGTDYEVHARFRAGATQGTAPFDELFMLGVERDNELWLRGHAGTRDGKKGSSPIGGNYALFNADFQKEMYRHALFTLSAGPLLDGGRTNDIFGRRPFRQWLVDTGVTASLKVAGAFQITLVYGRDLRGGGHALYATTGR